MPVTENRCRIARENAGLSVAQAAKLLGISRDELLLIEELDSAYFDANRAQLADVYGVNVGWLSGEVPLRDYDAMKGVKGWDDLLPETKDTIAEFAASLPRGSGSAEERLRRVREKKEKKTDG